MSSPPLTQEKKQAIIQDLQEDNPNNERQSLSSIAKKHNVGKATVSRIAKEIGYVTERSQTKRATEVRLSDLFEGRTRLALRHMKLSEKILDYYESLPPEALARLPQNTVAVLLGISTDKFKDLTPQDSDPNRHTEVDQWLDHVSGTA